MTCPDDEELARAVEGTLPEERRAALEAHVAECRLCRLVIGHNAELGVSRAPRDRVDEATTLSAERDDLAPFREGLRAAFTPSEPPVGTRIGRFEVLMRLGEGGMGTVYSAFDPELGRKAAIKVVREELGGSDLEARLLAEGKAMAKLAHPNIVAVYDAGRFMDRVFVAMELVEGQTLREWLRESREVGDIVAAFSQAGAGLVAAHEAGLVHRDFKPDNVLMGTDGRPRVTDFGLASSSDAEEIASEAVARPESLFVTRTGVVVGTPAYMAPEQLLGKSATPASDQFAFAVSLYEALYGVRPFASESFAALRKAVLEGTIGAAPKGKHVPRRLRAILVRALAVDPADRFASMSALLDALSRALVPRAWQKALPYLLAALGVLMIFLASRGVQRRAMCHEGNAIFGSVWDEAHRAQVGEAFVSTGAPFARDTAARISRLLAELGEEWSLQRDEACAATKVRGTQSDFVLGLRTACLDERLESVRALVELYGRADRTVVEHAVSAIEALPPLDRCRADEALRANTAPPDKSVEKTVRDARSKLTRSNLLREAAKADDALSIADAVLPTARDTGYKPLLAEALRARGLAMEASRPTDAAGVLEEAIAAAEAGRADDLAAELWIDLAVLEGTLNEHYTAADVALKRAEPALARIGAPPYMRARLDDAVGSKLRLEGKFAAALIPLRSALAVARQGQAGSTAFLADVILHIGICERDLGAFADAIRSIEESRTLTEGRVGAHHPDVAERLDALGIAYRKSEAYADARRVYEQSIAIKEAALGADSLGVAQTLTNLSVVLRNSGEPRLALEHATRARAIYEKQYGEVHPGVATSWNNIGFAEEKLGHLPLARAAYERALQIRAQIYRDANHPTNAGTYANLGRVDFEESRLADSELHWRRALAIDEATSGPNHPNVANDLAGLAKTLMARKKGEEARRLLARAEEIRKASIPAH